nr:LOW QUALITY PROTEIN: coiled-coil domain-containing protein 146 [Nothobranchius furzeri]
MDVSEEEQEDRPSSTKAAEFEGQAKPLDPVALSPDAPLAEISASSAFQILDEMLSLNKINQTTAAKLKANFKLLHQTLKCSQNSEIRLLGEAKRHRVKLKKLQSEVERLEQSSSEDPESEVSKLMRQLLQAYNQLKAAEEREYETHHELKCLWEEKQCLEKDVKTKPAELESNTKALKDECEDLRKEVALRQLDVRNLSEDVETHEMLVLKHDELEEMKKIIALKEAEKAGIIGINSQILKEMERKRSEWEADMKKMESLNLEGSETEHEVKVVDERNQSLRMMREEAIQELEGLKAQTEVCLKEQRRLLMEQEVSKEEMAELLGNRGILEMKLQNLMSDRKHLYERRSVLLREKSRQTQALTRMEQALAVASEQLTHTQAVYKELQAQLDAVPKRETGIQQRLELQKEVDALKASFEKQLALAEEESQKKQQYGMVQELLGESNRLREELHNLRCLRQIRTEERSQKHHRLLRTKHLNERIQQELREKDLMVIDHNKLYTGLQRRLSQYSKLCDLITEEKNKYVRLKETASQTITELTEQIKVLKNEMEMQHAITVSKDRSLTKARMEVSNCSKTRDKLRNDISEVTWMQHQLSQQSKDNEQELTQLQQMIKLQRGVLLEVNTRLDKATQRQTFLRIQLLEQDEVLVNYREQLNNLEAAVAKGNMALETLEKDMRELQLEMNNDRRHIELKRKEVLLKRKLEGEIAMLQIELSEARDNTLKGLNQPVGYRELKGKDPSEAELVHKMEQLEVNLAKCERQLLEKELLVKQVTQLSEPLRQQAENCKQDSLILAKKLNEVRTNIVSTNHRLMAISAELSIKQAAALSQQQQIKDKELQMDRCQRRLEQGLLPWPEMEEELRRMVQDKKKRQKDKEEKQRILEANGWNQMPNGKYTTAEARPDSYIPQNDPLGLPRPYGALAPCKPTKQGANMRHIREPSLRS